MIVPPGLRKNQLTFEISAGTSLVLRPQERALLVDYEVGSGHLPGGDLTFEQVLRVRVHP